MPLLVLLLVVLPIAELYVIVKVGGAIGFGPMLALLIAGSVLGAQLLRHRGRAAWRRVQAGLTVGRLPAREAVDGALIALGATLLLLPGFITDCVGIVLLLRPGRAIVRKIVMLRSGRLVIASFEAAARRAARGQPQPWPQAGSDSPFNNGSDIDTTATERTDLSERTDG